MVITSAEYKGSWLKVEDCPKENLPEFAFIGRSNVGKSSLINMLCGRKDLVKVSHTPGKTRMINFFLINDQFHFVDLPGYGYAKVSRKQRRDFEKMIFDYLGERKQLQVVFVLIDSRHAPLKPDLDFVNQLGERQIPLVLAFTKADKQSTAITTKNVNQFQEEMMKTWEALPQTFITSAVSKSGKDELWNYIQGLI